MAQFYTNLLLDGGPMRGSIEINRMLPLQYKEWAQLKLENNNATLYPSLNLVGEMSLSLHSAREVWNLSHGY